MELVKKRSVLIILTLIVGILESQKCDAQVFLQIEKFNSLDLIRLGPGDKIQYKTNEYKDTWRSETIDQILPDEGTLVIDGYLYKIEDFYKVSVPHSYGKRALGPILQSFGGGWLLFGGIGALFLNGDFTFWDAIIGTSAVGLGTLFKKVFKKRVFTMGQNSRLRIVDLRLFIPEVNRA